MDHTHMLTPTSAPYPRYAPTAAERKHFSAVIAEMLVGHTLMGSLVSSDEVPYFISDHTAFPGMKPEDAPPAWTDGLAVYISRTPSACFDGRSFFTMSVEEAAFLLAHEDLHFLCDDVGIAARFQSIGKISVPMTPERARVASFAAYPDGVLPFHMRVANVARDAVINATLLRDGVGRMPRGPKDPGNPKLHVPSGVTIKQIDHTTSFAEAYAIVWEMMDPPPASSSSSAPQPDQGDAVAQGLAMLLRIQAGSAMGGKAMGQTSQDMGEAGAGGDPDEGTGEGKTPHHAAPVSPAKAQAAMEQAKAGKAAAIQRAIHASKEAGQGTSSGAASLLSATVAPQVDWRDHLRSEISRTLGTSGYDWTRVGKDTVLRLHASRESFTPYFTPRRGAHGCDTVVFVGDVSGSINQATARLMLATLMDMLGEVRPRRCVLMWVDTEIVRMEEPDVDDDFTHYNVPEGGGTDFHPPFAWVRDNLDADEVAGLVYLTDLYGPAPSEPPPYPVLWLCVNQKKAPWGTTIHVPVSEG